MTLPTVSLTKGQIASFQEKGYLVLDALTTPDEVDRLRLIYDRLFSHKTGWDSGNQFDLAGTDEEDQATLPQLLGPSQYAPELKETRYLRNAQEIASQLLGEEMSPRNGEHMIYKPPGIGAATPWHQDQAYHDPGARRTASISGCHWTTQRLSRAVYISCRAATNWMSYRTTPSTTTHVFTGWRWTTPKPGPREASPVQCGRAERPCMRPICSTMPARIEPYTPAAPIR